MISDDQAREICADWHLGSSTAMFAYAVRGDLDAPAIRREIRASLSQRPDLTNMVSDLRMLSEWLSACGGKASA